MLAACAALIGLPIAMLVGHSLVDGSGHFGLGAFAQVLTDKSIAAAAVNSLLFVVYVTAGCLAAGVPLAWLVARTDVPAKLLIRGAIAVAFIIPSFINVIAWIFLAAPNSGTLNKLLVSWLGLPAPPFNIFSFGGLVFIETAHLFPIVFFAVAAALANIDASHEQAARMLGASRWRTTRTITLPLVAPAIISSATLVHARRPVVVRRAGRHRHHGELLGALDRHLRPAHLSAAAGDGGRGLAADRAVHAPVPVGRSSATSSATISSP